MEIKTNQLSGKALDWAVSKAIGEYKPIPIPDYSTDWAQGGAIIEREDISFRKYHKPDSEGHGTYYAMICKQSGSMILWNKKTSFQGITPLIAAMRCYVASKLGDIVEIPNELIEA